MNWVELSWDDHQQQTNESFNDPDVIETSSWQLWQFTGCRWCTWKVKLCLLVCLGWNRLSHVYCLLFVCCTCAEDDCSQPILWSDWDSPLTHKHQVYMCCTILWWHYQLVMIALLYSFLQPISELQLCIENWLKIAHTICLVAFVLAPHNFFFKK